MLNQTLINRENIGNLADGYICIRVGFMDNILHFANLKAVNNKVNNRSRSVGITADCFNSRSAAAEGFRKRGADFIRANGHNHSRL